MTRDEAHAAGLKTYDESRPCNNGHLNPKRYVSNGGCIDCMKRYRVAAPVRVVVPQHMRPAFEQVCSAMGLTILKDGKGAEQMSKAQMHDPNAVIRSPFQDLLDKVGTGAPPMTLR